MTAYTCLKYHIHLTFTRGSYTSFRSTCVNTTNMDPLSTCYMSKRILPTSMPSPLIFVWEQLETRGFCCHTAHVVTNIALVVYLTPYFSYVVIVTSIYLAIRFPMYSEWSSLCCVVYTASTCSYLQQRLPH